jgi:uncharacterized protein YbjT (DUF2867 family)
LRADGVPFVPVVRNLSRWPGPEDAQLTDVTDHPRLRAALDDATWVVSCAHARHAGAVLAAAPPKASFVFLGSTRKFTHWPDAHATGVIEGETAFIGSGRPGVMLHPTMIYGAEGENNVQRLAGLLRWLPVVPLPAGGRALVQPIYQDDVTRCIRAVLAHSWTEPESIVVAGPAPLPYRDFVQAVAQASSAGRRPIVSLPGPALMALARTARLIPGLPRVETAELRRLMEDKAFDIGPMRQKLGVDPIALTEGLARTFTPKHFARHADH